MLDDDDECDESIKSQESHGKHVISTTPPTTPKLEQNNDLSVKHESCGDENESIISNDEAIININSKNSNEIIININSKRNNEITFNRNKDSDNNIIFNDKDKIIIDNSKNNDNNSDNNISSNKASNNNNKNDNRSRIISRLARFALDHNHNKQDDNKQDDSSSLDYSSNDTSFHPTNTLFTISNKSSTSDDAKHSSQCVVTKSPSQSLNRTLQNSTKPSKPSYTPLERQVVDIKRQHADLFLFVECGYKYRFFGNDAEVFSVTILCAFLFNSSS